MSEFEHVDWRQLAKCFSIALVGSTIFGIVVYFCSDFVPDDQHPTLLIVTACLLWSVLACAAFQAIPILHLIAIATGLTWGLLISLSIAISIQNGRNSVNWPVMVPSLALMPFVAMAPAMPIWYLSKFRRRSE